MVDRVREGASHHEECDGRLSNAEVSRMVDYPVGQVMNERELPQEYWSQPVMADTNEAQGERTEDGDEA